MSTNATTRIEGRALALYCAAHNISLTVYCAAYYLMTETSLKAASLRDLVKQAQQFVRMEAEETTPMDISIQELDTHRRTGL